MDNKRKIPVHEIAADIRSDMTDLDVLEKYDLSPAGLREIMQKLYQVDLITNADLYRRTVLYERDPDGENRRKSHRRYLTLLLPVYEVMFPEVKGWVTDVTERGLGVRGLPANPGDLVTLVVLTEKYAPGHKIVFDAICQWAEIEAPGAEPTAGFQIEDISEENMESLRSLIRFLTVEG